MKRFLVTAALGCAVLVAGLAAGMAAGSAEPEWSMNTTIIEACSCPMFCQCYFNTKPAAHGGHEGHEAKHFCRANNAYKVNTGHYGDVKLDGAKYWLAADLGGDLTTGTFDWGVLTFDKATTMPQREAIKKIMNHLMPYKWTSFKTAEGDISWTAGGGEAHAMLDAGKTAEVKLHAAAGVNTPGEPTVIKNLKYWGAPRNDGFILMPNTVEAYRVGDKKFEYKGTNGFMITFEIDSKSVTAAAGK